MLLTARSALSAKPKVCKIFHSAPYVLQASPSVPECGQMNSRSSTGSAAVAQRTATFRNCVQHASGTEDVYPLEQTSCVRRLLGKYCDQEGSKEPSGDCAAGYYCQAGSTEQAPDVEDWPNASGKCPPGHYCPQGSVSRELCADVILLCRRQ